MNGEQRQRGDPKPILQDENRHGRQRKYDARPWAAQQKIAGGQARNDQSGRGPNSAADGLIPVPGQPRPWPYRGGPSRLPTSTSPNSRSLASLLAGRYVDLRSLFSPPASRV